MQRQLTTKCLKALRKRAARYDVGDSVVRGLQVRVSPSGLKTFRLLVRPRESGKLVAVTLGTYPELSLADAREKAREIRAQVQLGSDPQQERREAREEARRAISLSSLLRGYIAARERRPGLAPKTQENYSWLAGVVESSPLGSTPLPALRRAALRDLLEHVTEERGIVTANRLFQLLRAALRHAVREEMIQYSPLDAEHRPAKERPRERVLSDAEISALWRALNGEPKESEEPVPSAVVAAGVRILLLLGQRRTETLKMRWQDLDLAARIPVWTIPGETRKDGRPHAVPLPTQAVRIIKSVQGGSAERVFDGLSAVNVNRDWWAAVRERTLGILQKDKQPAERFNVHDLRRTCRSGLARLGVTPETAERVIGHKLGGIQAVYNVHDYLPEKASALATWAAHVEAIATGRRASISPMRRDRRRA